MRRIGVALGAAIGIVGWLGWPPVGAAHDLGGGSPPTDPVRILLAWSFDPLVVLGIVVGGAFYVRAALKVSAAHRANRWQPARTGFFAAGLATVVLALLSPVDGLSDDLAVVHMVQHSLLVFVAAPCFAASGIVTLALRVASRDVREGVLLPFLHSRFVKVVSFPVVGWLAFSGVMWGTHFTDLYNQALLDPAIHVGEHVLFLAAACLFWWPVFSPDPTPWRMTDPAKTLYMLTQMPFMSFLSVSILNASHVLWPAYLGRSSAFGLDPLTDQQAAGALMWGIGDATMIVAMGLVVLAWMRHEEGEARRVDARLERERRLAGRRR